MRAQLEFGSRRTAVVVDGPMDNLEPTSGNDMHREEDVRDTTPSSHENPRAPMDTHDPVISPIEHWTPAQEPPMASTQRRQNMSMQEALFNMAHSRKHIRLRQTLKMLLNRYDL